MSEKRCRVGWVHPATLGGALLAAILPLMAGTEQVAPPASPDTEQTRVAEAKRPVSHFKIYADNWNWTPDVIRVKKGNHVVLKLFAYRATRSFVLKAYKLDVYMPQDEEVTVEFDADRAGEFPFRCGRPCGNGCAKLRGKLIVD